MLGVGVGIGIGIDSVSARAQDSAMIPAIIGPSNASKRIAFFLACTYESFRIHSFRFLKHDKPMKTLQIRVPDDLRAEADQVLNEIGMDMSTAVRVYLKKIVQTRRIPFSLVATPEPLVEEVDVDAPTQTKMNAVADLWEQVRG
jgi:DNA-damage-inducible protein J